MEAAKMSKMCFAKKKLEISAESVKYIGGGVYFLLNLTALLHATLYTKINSFADTF